MNGTKSDLPLVSGVGENVKVGRLHRDVLRSILSVQYGVESRVVHSLNSVLSSDEGLENEHAQTIHLAKAREVTFIVSVHLFKLESVFDLRSNNIVDYETNQQDA